MQMSAEARAAKAEYMRTYRQTKRGRERIQAAQNAYWERKYTALLQGQGGGTQKGREK